MYAGLNQALLHILYLSLSQDPNKVHIIIPI